jgi:hypothetical protein
MFLPESKINALNSRKRLVKTVFIVKQKARETLALYNSVLVDVNEP